MTEDYPSIKEAFEYVENQLARRAREVGGIHILAQQTASNFLKMMHEGEHQKNCRGELYIPKNLQEIKKVARLSGNNFKKMFNSM